MVGMGRFPGVMCVGRCWGVEGVGRVGERRRWQVLWWSGFNGDQRGVFAGTTAVF